MNQQEVLRVIDETIRKGPFRPSWDSLEAYRAPQWYQDAKFGIFIHWGVYSVPAFGNEWYPRNMYIKGTPEYQHHIERYGRQSEFGYKDFIPMFRAEHFDPDDWAELFRKAGARYVVPVAEHHDGFQMYRSGLSRWNAAEMGPHRDVVGELSAAVRSRGMTFGASSHRAEHWWFLGGGRHIESDVNDPKYQDFYGPAHDGPGENGAEFENYAANSPDEAYLENWLARTGELILNYQPQILFFDWWIMNLAFKPYLKKLAAFYYNCGYQWDRGVAINSKYDAYPVGTTVLDLERGQLGNTRPLLWQTDTAVANNSWGYTENNTYKTPYDIVCNLCDIVSKNGVLLLNIGPKSDGTIPDEDRRILTEIGAWLEKNGEAIYGTRTFARFGEGPTKIVEGAFSDVSRQQFTSEDIRFTTKPGALYAICMKRPENNRVTIHTLAGDAAARIARAEMLDTGAECAFTRAEDGLHVSLGSAPQTEPFVLKLFLAK